MTNTTSDTIWQPIETAPKDGTRVLLAYPGGHVRSAYCIVHETIRHGVSTSVDCWVDGQLVMRVKPTQWAPMPDHPCKGAGAGWKPIETAPIDGTVVLVAHGANGVGMARYDDVVSKRNGQVTSIQRGWSAYAEDWRGPPTHWMPLPSAPAHDAEAVR